MTLTLAIDTATDTMVTALGDAQGVRAEMTLGRRRHAASLVPAIVELCRSAGASLADVTDIIVADGPGSFTGLRIGMATVQGLVRAHEGITLWKVPSLLVTARVGSAFVDGAVAALYDALRGDVYGAVYRFREDGLDTLLAPTLGTVSSLSDALPDVPGVVLGVGDGAVAYADEVVAWTGRAPVGPPYAAPDGAALLSLATVPGALTRVADPTALEPTYGRPAEAQARWEKAHGRSLPDSPGQFR